MHGKNDTVRNGKQRFIEHNAYVKKNRFLLKAVNLTCHGLKFLL